MRNRSQIGVRIAPRSGHGFGTSSSPRPFGSMRSRIQISSSSVGRRDVGTSASIASSKPVARDDVVDGDAGMHGAQPHAVVGSLEVEDAEVGDDAVDVVEPSAVRFEIAGPVVADTAHDVDGGYEGAGRVRGDPVRGLVVDRVARRAPHAEQLRARRGMRADEREVLVAELVDLAPAHHHVAPPRPHDVEHRAVRVPARDDLLGVLDADGEDVLDEERLAVGHHELGRDRRLGEAPADDGKGADRVGEDLAVVRETVGDRGSADLGSGGRPVRHTVSHAFTACWYSPSLTSIYRARNSFQASSDFAEAVYARWNASSRG